MPFLRRAGLGASIVLLLLFRFVFNSIPVAEWIIWHLGYIMTWVAVIFTGYFSARFIYEKRTALRKHVFPALTLGFLLALVQSLEPHLLRVASDEQSHLAIAIAMHEDRRIELPLAIHEVEPTVVISAYAAPFRSHLFSFFTSLAIDAGIGWRIAPYIVNALAAYVVLISVYLIAFQFLKSRAKAVIPSVLLLFTPIFGQVMCSGAYDMVNLAMLALMVYFLLKVLSEKNTNSILMLIGSAVLLSYARAESIAYLVVILPVVLSAEKWKPSVTAITAPIFLILAVAIQNMMLGNKVNLYQSSAFEKGSSLWSFDQLAANLQDSVFYFLSGGVHSMGSPLLFVTGFSGLILIFKRTLAAKQLPAPISLVLLGLCGISTAFFCLVMGSYWGGPSNNIMTRFTLPLWLMFALGSIVILRELTQPGSRRLFPIYGILAVWIGVFALPVYSKHEGSQSFRLSMYENEMADMASKIDDGRTLYVAVNQYSLVARKLPCVESKFFSSNIAKYIKLMHSGAYSRVIFVELQKADGPDFAKLHWDGSWNKFRRVCITQKLESKIMDYGFVLSLSEFKGLRMTDGIIDATLRTEKWPEFADPDKLRAYIHTLYPTSYGGLDI